MSLRTASALVVVISSAGAAFAAPTYNTSVLINYDPNAATSNFSSPGTANNQTAYTVRTGADANNFYVDVTVTGNSGNNLSGYQFANIYVGGANFNTGLIFEVTNNRVSTTDNPGGYYLPYRDRVQLHCSAQRHRLRAAIRVPGNQSAGDHGVQPAVARQPSASQLLAVLRLFVRRRDGQLRRQPARIADHPGCRHCGAGANLGGPARCWAGGRFGIPAPRQRLDESRGVPGSAAIMAPPAQRRRSIPAPLLTPAPRPIFCRCRCRIATCEQAPNGASAKLERLSQLYTTKHFQRLNWL